jgi:hypothetical protein
MGIDRTLLRGVTVDLGTTLLDGLAINGPAAFERCRRLLSEPEDIVERRSELEKRASASSICPKGVRRIV